MAAQRNDKAERVLRIYTKLLNGGLVNKAAEALTYGVNERSIQRDMDDIRNFLALEQAENGCVYSIVYDRVQKGYRMQKVQQTGFSGGELLAMCKLLLGSRAFSKTELNELLEKIISHDDSRENQELLKALIGNEVFHYEESQHKTAVIDTLWNLAKAVRGCHYIEFSYMDTDKQDSVPEKLKPVAILFSDYYFYLVAFDGSETTHFGNGYRNQSVPLVFRVDQIQNLKIMEEHFHIPYSKRFEEGEFRKQINE